MTATLVAKDLAAGHGDRVLFSGLDLVVAPGDVIGLVGANGAGKSTLLRLLAGLDTPEDGELSLSPPTATVGHLPQEPERRPGETVRAFLARRTGVADAQLALDAATQALVDERARRGRRLRRRRWSAGSRSARADLDERAEEVADAARPGHRPRPADDRRSPAARRPAPALASLLLSRYDVFLLDEPTNDLDLDGLRPPGVLRHGAARRHRPGQPRPRVPDPHGHPRRRTRPRPAAGQHSTAAATPPTWRSASGPGGTPASSYEEYADTKAGSGDPGAHAAQLDGEGRQERPPQGPRQRQDRPQGPRARPPRSRPPRPSRPSA